MGRLSLYIHIAVAVLAGVLVWFFQAARLGADLADERLQASTYREQITTERAAANARVAKVSRDMAANYQGALNDAIKKQATLQAAADRSRRERDSLRNTIAAASLRLPDAAPSACTEYATASSGVLDQCAAAYQELAEKADQHAASVKLMQDAWPPGTQ